MYIEACRWCLPLQGGDTLRVGASCCWLVLTFGAGAYRVCLFGERMGDAFMGPPLDGLDDSGCLICGWARLGCGPEAAARNSLEFQGSSFSFSAVCSSGAVVCVGAALA